VHFGGTALINTYGAGTMLELAKRANEQGCTVSFDPNIRPALIPEDDSNRVADALTQALDLADIVVCSPDDLELLEAEMATGAALAEWLLSQGPHTAFVTLGSDGAVVSSSDAAPWGESAATHPGFDLNTVDTTGAGDSFASAIITRLVEDSEPSMDTVLRFANATAALTTRTQGGLSALPSRQEVRQFWE
jgi:fructokinase